MTGFYLGIKSQREYRLGKKANFRILLEMIARNALSAHGSEKSDVRSSVRYSVVCPLVRTFGK